MLRWVVSGVFQCRPSALEKDALLRIEDLGVAGAVSEKGGVELIDPIQHDATANEVLARARRRVATRSQDLGVAEFPDRFPTGAKIAPEFFRRPGIRETATETDHRDDVVVP